MNCELKMSYGAFKADKNARQFKAFREELSSCNKLKFSNSEFCSKWCLSKLDPLFLLTFKVSKLISSSD